MEIINIIILVVAIIQMAFMFFLVMKILKLNNEVDNLASLVNKSIMTSEDFRNNLTDFLDSKNKEVNHTITEGTQEVKLQVGYIKSTIETNTEKTRLDLEQIKDRLDYLSTDVPIK